MMQESQPPRLPLWLRALGWAVLGGTLIAVLHTVFWYGTGRAEFNMHWGIPDRMLGFGEAKLYLLMLLLGLPAGACFARIAKELPGFWTLHFAPFWRSRRGLLVPAVVAATGSFCIAQFVTHYAWFTDDEQAYLVQAWLYAHGMLTAPVIEPSVLLRQAFVVPVLPQGGVPQWTGVYPPFQPFLMAISSWLGNINLSQFLCVGLITYNTGRFAQRFFGKEAMGPTVAWLCAFSPLLLGLGSTYHTSVLATILTVWTARLLLWVFEKGGVLRGVPLGIVAGSIVLARPMEGTLVVGFTSAIAGFEWLQRWLRGRAGKETPKAFPLGLALLGFGLGGLLPLAITVTYNMQIATGTPFGDAYSILRKEIGGFFGFGGGMMWGRTHSASLGWVQTVSALVRLNAFVLGWPLSLGLVALSFWEPFRDRRTFTLLALSGIHLCAYFFLAFGSVHDFGHAYHVWHVPTITLVSAWVLVRSTELAGDSAVFAAVGRWLRLAVVSMAVVAFSVFWPAQLTRWSDVSGIVLAPVRAAEAAAGGKKAIILWGSMQPPGTQRTWVFRPPAPLPNGQLWWSFDSPPWYPELKRLFPDRAFYRLTWNGEIPVVTPVTL